MDIKLIKTLWGYTEGATGDTELKRVKQAGFDGVEWAPPGMPAQQWKELCAKHDLLYCAQIFADSAQAFAVELKRALEYGPAVVTAHDGRDKMTFAEGCTYFKDVLAIEADSGVPVAHETHRHRLFYAPWSTAQYLNEFPDLKICADFSHWCCVCESMLDDMEEWVTLACERAIHIHGRVGWEEGPQVADPRAPEFRHYVERHEQWWDRILEARSKAFADSATFNPEFGPPGYMPAQPYTQQPIANLWDVHLWMANRLRTRWRR